MKNAALYTSPSFDVHTEHLNALQRAIDDIEYTPVGGRGEIQKALDYFKAHSTHQGGISLFFLGLRENRKDILIDALALIQKYFLS